MRPLTLQRLCSARRRRCPVAGATAAPDAAGLTVAGIAAVVALAQSARH